MKFFLYITPQTGPNSLMHKIIILKFSQFLRPKIHTIYILHNNPHPGGPQYA